MSKFFRSGNSTSSSSESSESLEEEVEAEEVALQTLNGDTARVDTASTTATSVPPQPNHYRDFLLHALLEERCVNEVLATYAGHPPRRDAPEVQAEAGRRYRRLCERLASYNLISTGLEEDRHASIRQRYRDGLDVLSQQQTSSTSAVAPTLRRLLTEPDPQLEDLQLIPFNAPTIAESFLPFPLRRLLSAPGGYDGGCDGGFPDTNSEMLRRTLPTGRFDSEFEQLGTLGSGGYGIVYQVKHRLDGQGYAVKKVPLSPKRLHRIHQRGQPELEEVLKEIRTLARLDHPNVVRYFNGWIEWIDVQASDKYATTPHSGQAVSGADNISGGGVVFEYSSSPASSGSQGHSSLVLERSGSGSAMQDNVQLERVITISSRTRELPPDNNSTLSFSEKVLTRVGTKSTIATVTDDDGTIESVDRTLDPSFATNPSTGLVNFKQSTFALHMQMSLHPLTLHNLLDSDSAPVHCYHLPSSISILLPVLDGLAYLHNQGIIHRDIKPGNIFLGSMNTDIADGIVHCDSCPERSFLSYPKKLEVRIGDFGLVSVADPDAAVDLELHQGAHSVGTKTYLPPAEKAVTGPDLDLYALAIVAFELLCKFDSQFERYEKIRQLKAHCFPEDFCLDLETECKKEVMACIMSMLGSGERQATVGGVREMLVGLSTVDEKRF